MTYRKQGKLLMLGTNTKLNKAGEDWLVAGLSLAPSNLSGYRVCTHEKHAGCKPTCLYFAGRGAMPSVQTSRINKTKLLFEDQHTFYKLLDKEIYMMVRYADRKKKRLALRLNVLSDLDWENRIDMESYPVQFYDYTKRPNRLDHTIKNYDLTLSMYPNLLKQPAYLYKFINYARKTNTNITAVFKDKIPEKFFGYPTINGDDNDLRFLDPKPCCVALKAKGKLRNNPDAELAFPEHLSNLKPLEQVA